VIAGSVTTTAAATTCQDQCSVLAREAGASAANQQERNNRTLFTGAMFENKFESRNGFGAHPRRASRVLEFGCGEYVGLVKYADDSR
jgi:hypothetical protein